MHSDRGNPGDPLAPLAEGTPIGPVAYPVSPAANDRYWAGAGIAHPARAAGLLYPPLAANLTVLATQSVRPGPLLHARQHLVAHRAGVAGRELRVEGRVAERSVRRGRDRAVVEVVVADDEGPLWTSTATFLAPGAARRPDEGPAPREESRPATPAAPGPADVRTRTLRLDEDLLRTYSRRGNFHSDAQEAARIGMPGLVAQGMQVAGPAYGLLLDAWGESFLAHGTLELTFTAMVTAGDTAVATVTLAGDAATIAVHAEPGTRLAVVGTGSLP